MNIGQKPSTGYFYILLTIVFTVYGQLILKWRVRDVGDLPAHLSDKAKVLLDLIFDPWIISGFLAAVLASLTWMAAMTKFDLSHAYPFMALNFVVVLALSSCLLGETVSLQKIIGVALICIGTVVAARG
jgi:uncharacterized membrane protein